MMRSLTTALLLLTVTAAAAQEPPVTMPINSVYGRLQANGLPGPGSAIPISSLFSTSMIGLAQGGLGASQAGATANQIPVFPGGGGGAVPTSLSTLFANNGALINPSPMYFGSGQPWCDVRAKGATATMNGANIDDSAAFQACFNLSSIYGTIWVYVPPGAYCIKTQVVDTGGTGNVRLTGAAVGLGFVGATPQGTIISSCGVDTTLFHFSHSRSGIENLRICGKGDVKCFTGTDNFGTFGATNPNIIFDTGSDFSEIRNVESSGGSSFYVLHSADLFDYKTQGQMAYGTAIKYFGGTTAGSGNGARIYGSATDHPWPSGNPPNSGSVTSVTPWSATHTYPPGSLGTIAQISQSTVGWRVQLQVDSCITGGSQPAVQNYTVPINDNTCQWLLMGHAPYYCLQWDSGSGEGEANDLDMGCPGDYAIAFTNVANPSLNGPTNIVLSGLTIAPGLFGGIGLLAGQKVTIKNSHASNLGGLIAGQPGINIPSLQNGTFSGNGIFINNFFPVASGQTVFAIASGSNYVISGNILNGSLGAEFGGATFTATTVGYPTPGTSVTVSGVTGLLGAGMPMSGAGVTAGTTITSQTSGTPGGAGVYVINQSQAITGVSAKAGVSNFLFIGNDSNTGACVTVDTGGSDYYNISNNICAGGAVTDNALGAHRTTSPNN